ncbi:MAG: hypothetical protein IJX81_00615 [Clostridia bacterium]|nr:hypothetical protein [Clostridia bacterium]
MSKKNKAIEIEATNEELKEILATDGKVTEGKKQPKHVMSRIFALLFAAIPVVACFLLGICVVYAGESAYVISNEQNLLNVILAAFGVKGNLTELYAGITGAAATAPEFKVFGFLPSLAGSGNIGALSSILVYAIAVVMVITVILAIIALFSGKAAPALARCIAGVNFATYFIYGTWMLTLGLYLSGDQFVIVFDLIAYAIASVSFLAYFIYSAIRAKKHIFLGTLILLFTTIATTAVALIYVALASHVLSLILAGGTSGLIALIVTAAIIAITAVSYVIALHSLSVKKVYGADIVRTVLLLLIGAFFIFAALMNSKYVGIIFFGGVVAAAALLQLIVQSLAVSVNRKKAKKAKAAALEAEAVETEVVEEDDGATLVEEVPVEEIEEETPDFEAVEEAQAEPAPEAVTADYDYYNSRSFDPFVASLTSAERAQFTELFILKYKGEMGNIPEYTVGGDNKEFFNKVFINLGSIRERLSDELLNKLYQFAIRM